MFGSTHRSTLAVLALTAVALASCTSRENAAPVTAGPDTTIAAATTESETTTTTELIEPPATDPPATDPPATDAPPATATTTPPPSGTPTPTLTLVFAGGAADGWFHMGQWTGAQWQAPLDPAEDGDDATPREPAVTSGDSVIVHELDVAPADGEIGTGAAAPVCGDDRLGPTITPDPGAPESPDFGYRAIAFPADWDTQPRPVAVVDADVAAYVEAGQAVFDDADTSTGTVKQIVVTDLDGDGDSEALVAFGGPTYSTLMLIDTESRTALTIASSIAEVTVPTTAVEGDPEPDPVTGTFSRFRTLMVADANGDGFMEFAVHSWEDGEATATLHTYDGTDVTTALTASC